MKNFRVHTKAIELYKLCKNAGLNTNLQSQLTRASSSVALNLAEGNGRITPKDRRRFFNIAYASAQEVKSISLLEDCIEVYDKADNVAKMIFVLCRNLN